MVDNNEEKALVRNATDSFSDGRDSLCEDLFVPSLLLISTTALTLVVGLLSQQLTTRYFSILSYHENCYLKKILKIPPRIMILFSANGTFLHLTGFTDLDVDARKYLYVFFCLRAPTRSLLQRESPLHVWRYQPEHSCAGRRPLL